MNKAEKTFLCTQDNYIRKVKDILINSNKKTFVKTYGCQQNFSDSEKIKGILQLLGFELTNEVEDADFILFNTCAIREHAEERVFGNVGALKNLKKRNKNLVIVLCGCMMEQEHVREKIKKSFPFVDLVFGTRSMNDLPKLFYEVLAKKRNYFVQNNDNVIPYEDIPTHREGKIKCAVPIMYGCDNFCSYCIVPYVRGRERSRQPDDILNEIKNLVNKGYKEITLLGQNVNSYGKNLGNSTNFSRLLEEIDKISGDFWVRFMTSHPKDASKELIDTIAASKHICHQLHLPFQSGNDRILKAMNRRLPVLCFVLCLPLGRMLLRLSVGKRV